METMSDGINIRPMAHADALDILSIYQQGIDTGHATFQSEPPTWQQWDDDHLASPRFVAEVDKQVAGWVALSATSSRCVYAGVAEVSIYIGSQFGGRGIGSALLGKLIVASEAAGIWTLTAGIFPENEASVRLHQKAGFKLLGRREKLGKMTFGPMAGQWRDVLSLERRSTEAQFS